MNRGLVDVAACFVNGGLATPSPSPQPSPQAWGEGEDPGEFLVHGSNARFSNVGALHESLLRLVSDTAAVRGKAGSWYQCAFLEP